MSMGSKRDDSNTFAGRLYVTLDTEMDADIHWKKLDPPEFTSVYEGIPQILRPIWNRQRVHPIYFVSPEVVRDMKCCEILKQEIAQGAIIGAHLHPEYIEPYVEAYQKSEDAQFPCYAYDKEIEKEKIENLTQMIQKNLGVNPIWYRAARYGADNDTIKILEELGYENDSSITPCINWSSKNGPDHSKNGIEGVRDYRADSSDMYCPVQKGNKGIHEFPITIMGKRWGLFGKLLPDNWMLYRWLRPSHMFLCEQKGILRQARRMELKNIVLMFHSMEVMVGKTPFVRFRWMQAYYLWRLEKTLIYARKKGYRL